ncbi:hypothetical protein D3C81_1398500 [compost metagenome]
MTGTDPCGAKNPLHQFTAPGSHQAEQPDDLSGPHAKIDRRFDARCFQPLELQTHRPQLTWLVAIDVTQIAPDHRLHQLRVIHLLHIVKGAHVAAIFKHGNGVAEGKYFFHTVRDIQDHPPFGT